MEAGIVDGTKRRQRLKDIFDCLDADISGITKAKEDILTALQAFIDDLLKPGVAFADVNQIDQDEKPDIDPDSKEGLMGTDICYRGCGRYYHFTMKCCADSHRVKIADTNVAYIVHNDRIYLEKCAAFSVMGRMCVVRFSDYRTIDRVIGKLGMEISTHFLYEHSLEDKITKPQFERSRQKTFRRTHISLEAFKTLVDKGYATNVTSDAIKASIDKLDGKTPILKSKCSMYVGHDKIDLQHQDALADGLDDNEAEDHNVDQGNESSSGIESGGESSSGKSSPTSMIQNKVAKREEDEDIPDNNKVFTEPVADGEIKCFLDANGKVYAKTSTLAFIVNEDPELFFVHLKRKFRSIDLDHAAFLRRQFDERQAFQDFSLECFTQMIERGYLKKLKRDYKKEAVVADLRVILAKHQPDDGDFDDEEALVETEDPDCESSAKDMETEDDLPLASEAEEFFEDFENEADESEAASASASTNDGLDDLGGQQMVVSLSDDLKVHYHVVGSNIFLERRPIWRHLTVNCPRRRNMWRVESILKEVGLKEDEAFVYYGRQRRYISTMALRALLNKNYLITEKPEEKTGLFKRLDELEENKAALMAKKVLRLPSFNGISYKLCRNTVFLNTRHFLYAIGASSKYVEDHPSRSYSILVRMLAKRGLNTNKCFLKQAQSKYGHISIYGVMTLFKTDSGPFRDRKRIKQLQKELQAALKDLPFYKKKAILKARKRKGRVSSSNPGASGSGLKRESGTSGPAAQGEVVDEAHLTIGNLSIKYQVKDGVLFLQRKAIFEAMGLEQNIISSWRGFPGINKILSTAKIEVGKAYLKAAEEQYAYISFPALWTLLESEDPMMIGLEKRQDFYDAFLDVVQRAIALSLRHKRQDTVFDSTTRWEWDGRKLRFEKLKTLALAGLVKPEDVHSDALIDFDSLLNTAKLDGEIKRASDYANMIWTDMIAAVVTEGPKLRVKVKMVEFRKNLHDLLQTSVIYYLENYTNIMETCSSPSNGRSPSHTSPSNVVLGDPIRAPAPPQQIKNEEEAAAASSILVADSDVVMMSSSDEANSEASAAMMTACNHEEFEKILASIQSMGTGMIGDWQVKRCDHEEVRLLVNPGYGASKKVSFVQPDMSAILKYELVLKPNIAPLMTINDLKVSDRLLEPVFRRESKNGLFSLAYTLLTMRPCFGNFQPEVVETFEKRSLATSRLGPDDSGMDVNKLVIDTNFIGSSQNGRTYAGTVRSKNCTVLATSRVSDVCVKCSALQGMTINRSVLSSPRKGSVDSVASSRTSRSVSHDSNNSSASSHSSTSNSATTTTTTNALQQSVWKVEESSAEGCTFVCPQLQSYNTSLPHQFMSTSQATSVVDHRAVIGSDLSLKVTLNNKSIVGKSFGDFEKTKQVGPLLDYVASLRMCVGYPDTMLVGEAKYLLDKIEFLSPEVKRFFNFIMVDDAFTGKMNSPASSIIIDLKGTMRAKTCKFAASDHADICDQCRMLQEPLNFLNL